MSTSPTAFDIIFQGWQEYQDKLSDTVRPLTAAQLAVSATDNLRTAGAIVTHIVAARANWFVEDLKEGDAEIAAIGQWDASGQPTRTAADLAHDLAVTWKLMQDALARWTPAELVAPLILEGFESHPVSRAWVIWHLLEHDLHHGGELALLLGSHDIAVQIPPGPPAEG
jgi:uncharacterized damage-inducible protein DinB